MSDCALIIFVKNPAVGRVKSRLAATIGAQEAYRIYLRMLEHTRSVATSLHVKRMVFYSEKIDADDLWNTGTFSKFIQQGEDLGERMKNAFAEVFAKGYNKAVLIGSDCFDLTEQIIISAFNDLNIADVVIGPAKDGGYYLIAMKYPIAELFNGIQYSTPLVLCETIEKCTELNLSYSLLPTLNDVDVESDLPPELKNEV